MKNRLLTGALVVLCSAIVAAQTCNDDVTETSPASEFTINGDGTVTHLKTGLVWMQCSLGQTWEAGDCTGTATTYDWQAALDAAESEEFASETDWRLPNIKELGSIVEMACYSPAINETIFPETQSSFYWSSSPSAYYSYGAWILSFYSGSDYGYNKGSDCYVRLVRGQ